MVSEDRVRPFIRENLCYLVRLPEPRQCFSLPLCFCCFILSHCNFFLTLGWSKVSRRLGWQRFLLWCFLAISQSQRVCGFQTCLIKFSVSAQHVVKIKHKKKGSCAILLKRRKTWFWEGVGTERVRREERKEKWCDYISIKKKQVKWNSMFNSNILK